MTSRSKSAATIVVALALVLAIAVAASSRFTCVTTRGISMNPLYYQGDLVVVQRTGDYKVGDIIGYHSAKLRDSIVLHRIIEVDEGHFVTQGDNNSFIDPDRPTEADVVGEAWLHVPKVGSLLGGGRRNVLFGVVGVLVAAGSMHPRRRRSRRRTARRRARWAAT